MREVLPNRRFSETISFRHGVFDYRATVGFYPDGRAGEVFLNAAKTGVDLDVATRDSAIALSFALQHGCRIETICSAMTRDEQGRPAGALGILVDQIGALEVEKMAALAVAAEGDNASGGFEDLA